MKIGVPKEIKTAESRVALLPDACSSLVRQGNVVVVQKDAGLSSGFYDAEYKDAGCQIGRDLEHIYSESELIIKVKEPQPEEYSLLQPQQTLFCYLHLAANNVLQQALLDSGVTAISFEGITDDKGELPLLRPMSIIAGKLAAQYSCIYLHSIYGGRGILIDGIENVAGANVAVLGYGSAGSAAVEHFAQLGAQVVVIEKSEDKLKRASEVGSKVHSLPSTPKLIEQTVRDADVIVGAVLIPNQRAPVIVKKEWVSAMHRGAVIIDIAVDQGGCIETTHPTTYEDPVYVEEGVIHFAVQNMPAAVPRTASQALSAAILPTAISIAEGDWRKDKNIMSGLSVDAGMLI